MDQHQPPQVSLDTAIGLSFDYLKQLGTISMTAAGGLIALVQFVEGDRRFFVKIMIATALMFLSALMAFFVQLSMIDRIRQGHEALRSDRRTLYTQAGARRLERVFEGAALWLLSIGVGMALQALVVAGAPA